MHLSLDTEKLSPIFNNLRVANEKLYATYPGDKENNQPVQTLYGGAQLFKAETPQKIAALALKHLKLYAKDAREFGEALQLTGDQKFWELIYQRVISRLEKQAIEDYRIDFEDGYGNRPDAEEDQTAQTSAIELAKAMEQNSLPPFIGIRIKAFNQELIKRSTRTLDIFLSTLLQKSNGKLPNGFIVTLPKVTIPEQVEALVSILELIEEKNQLPKKSIRCEIMIETTQAIFGAQGNNQLLGIVQAGQGRCRGAHFGTYDYTASCDITAAYQTMTHPNCTFALQMMKVALAGTGVWLSDGATSLMPVAPNSGENLSPEQILENKQVVHHAWREAFNNTRNSLQQAFYQGWDLHPGQLPIRYAACYAFFLENLEQASKRLKNFIEKAAQATLVGNVFDDAATGQGLLNYFLRALESGAITEDEVKQTGLSVAEVKSKSFLSIVKNRVATQ